MIDYIYETPYFIWEHQTLVLLDCSFS